LRFNEKQHDFGLQDDIITSTKTFTPKTGSYKNWTKDEIDIAMQYAAATLRKLGYEVER